MTRRRRLSLLRAVFLAALPSAGGAEQEAQAPPAKPNLLILLADDLGYADLGCQGATDVPTPNIDSIAANGIRCTSGYVTGCVCSPSRGALLTSRYQQRYGLDTLSDLTPIGGLSGEERTLAELLEPAGYVSAVFGKWHLGSAPDQLPEAQGFDEFCYGEPLNHAGSPLAIRRAAKDPIVHEKFVDNITTVIGREVPAFIERHKSEPWFAYVAFKAPHMPQQPPRGYVDRLAHIQDKDRRLYCASVAAQDDTVGLILAALRASGQEERTLIVYLSDNGGANVVAASGRLRGGGNEGPLRAKAASSSSNHPLRGTKGSLWEGGIRVPMLLQWKGALPAGKTYDRPITQMDIGATFLAAAGAKEDLPRLDGVDVLPHLTGREHADPHAALYWTYLGGQSAVRAGDWKLVRAKDGSGAIELYDLSTDVAEVKNVAAENADKVKELEKLLAAWIREVGYVDRPDVEADE